ncbi:unnamed protein product [Lactuca saligna]|uniref:Uncharacterized protein n=1 Tax=Lactuca saligna TaxID=75948 RepID=A0AA35Y6J7_LACSI|nr:unnamed protein product [Lactuca saligna]
MDDSHEDPQLPHIAIPMSSSPQITYQLNPNKYEEDEELEHIRATRGYNDMLKMDVEYDEEIRYCLEGSGYFDVTDKDDHWILLPSNLAFYRF